MDIREAWNILKEEGFKRTKHRERILEYVAAHDRYMTALEIRDVLAVDHPGISYDTIYRNLSTFVELSILEETELEGERHFRMQCDASTHHHHFICRICGKTETIPHCPLDLISLDLPDHSIEGHKFEVYGTCPDCLTA